MPLKNQNVLNHFLALDQPSIQAEYIWIDGTGIETRSKSRTLDGTTRAPSDPSSLPSWNYDGSSTGQAAGSDSEVILKPCRIFRDPFRGGENILVLCNCYRPDGTPLETNNRDEAARLFNQALDEKPWFGMEQEYTLFDPETDSPLGWPRHGFPAPQGPYYCSAGVDRAFGRDVVDSHYRACLYAGIQISGVNAEVMPGQWEFQVGPAEGIDAADQMTVARYLLHRIGEMCGVRVSLDPKPVSGDWNGAGMHTNFSTARMRAPGGLTVIQEAIDRLGKKHMEHIAVYGKDNDKRLTGQHETAPIHKFSHGVANRGASIRIPRSTEADGCGYFEDRRPASNCCPYQVTSKIFKTAVLGE